MTGSSRITKAEWYLAGGLENPKCWRRFRSGSWQYFIRIEEPY